MATYNGARFLHEQLDSIVTQTWSPIELCVSDDASSDQTRAILAHYAHKHSWIRVAYHDKNVGYQKNFERAVRMCLGDYVALSDQDDVWKTNKIERLVEALGSGELITSNALIVDAALSSKGKTVEDHYRIQERGHTVAELMVHNRYPGCMMLLRTQFLRSALPFPSRFPHDAWLAALATARGTLRYTGELLTCYRQHDTNTAGATPARSIPFFGRFRRNRRRIFASHRARYEMYHELCLMLAKLKNNGPALRYAKRLADFHLGYTLHSFRPKAPFVAWWIMQRSVRSPPIPIAAARFLLSFFGNRSGRNAVD